MLIFIWNFKGPRITTTMLREKNQVDGLTHLNFTTFYGATLRQCVTAIKIDKEMNGIELSLHSYG